jgi:hypothetical protein
MSGLCGGLVGSHGKIKLRYLTVPKKHHQDGFVGADGTGIGQWAVNTVNKINA